MPPKPPKRFIPPKYVETLHYIFDKRTGEIVATEKRWTLVRGKARVEPRVQPALLKSVASQAEKRAGELDVLLVRKRRLEGVAVRVDVRKRKLIVEKAPAEFIAAGSPHKLPSP